MAEHDPRELVERAEAARQAGDYPTAYRLYRRSIELLPEPGLPPVYIVLWRRAAQCALRLARLDDAEACLHEAAANARVAADPRLGPILAQLGALVADRARPGEAARYHHEALELARDAEDVHAEATALGNLGLLALRRGDLGAARAHLVEALTAYQELGDPGNAANALNSLGEVERALGNEDDALGAFREAARIWEAVEEPAGQALALSNIGHLARAAGQLDQAEAAYERAHELAVDAGDALREAAALGHLGIIAAARGHRDAARQHYEAAAEIHRAAGTIRELAADQVNLANLAVDEGRLEEAMTSYREAQAAFAGAHDARAALDAACMAAQIEARRGDIGDAERAFEAALVTAEELGYQEAIGRIRFNLAAVAYARGDVAAGIAGFDAGAARFEALEMPAEQATCLLIAAEAHMQAGRYREAHERLLTAIALLDATGATRQLLEARASLASVEWAWGREDGPEQLLAAAAALARDGQRSEALRHRLVVADDRAAAGDHHELAKTLWSEARELGIGPLELEAESACLASAPTAGPDEVARSRELVERARAWSLELLVVRAERRLALVLDRAGEADEARAVREDAAARAEAMGAVLEAERLRRALG